MFKPRSIPLTQLEKVHLEWSELEALRLCDLEDHDQEAAGRRMGVSRGTVYRLLKSGRTKLIEAIVQEKALIISKGENDENLSTD